MAITPQNHSLPLEVEKNHVRGFFWRGDDKLRQFLGPSGLNCTPNDFRQAQELNLLKPEQSKSLKLGNGKGPD